MNAVQDFSALDEPVLPVGPFFLSFRRAAYLAVALAAAGALAASLSGPVLAVLPGGFPLTPGILLGAAAAGALLAPALREPGALSLESQLLLSALPPPREGGRRGEAEPEDYTLRADPDLGVAEAELLGVAVDPATGRPFDRVAVDVDGVRYEAAAEGGRYRLTLELARGTHTIRILIPDTDVTARLVRVRVV